MLTRHLKVYSRLWFIKEVSTNGQPWSLQHLRFPHEFECSSNHFMQIGTEMFYSLDGEEGVGCMQMCKRSNVELISKLPKFTRRVSNFSAFCQKSFPTKNVLEIHNQGLTEGQQRKPRTEDMLTQSC